MMNQRNKSKRRNNMRLLVNLTIAAILTTMVFTAGCGLSKRSYPEKNFFTLRAPLDNPAAGNQRPGMLLVGNIVAAAPLDSPGLVYKIEPNLLRPDFYNELVAPPSRLWREALVQYMAKYGPVSEASMVPGFKTANYGLEGFLTQFHADITGDTPQAVVSIKLTLSNLDSPGRAAILDKTYQRRMDLSDDSPQTLVVAFNQIMADILAEFNRDWRNARSGRR